MRIRYFILIFAALMAFASCGEKKKKSYDEIAMSGLTVRHPERNGLEQMGMR